MAACSVSTQVAGEGETGAGLFARCFGGRGAGSLSHVFNGSDVMATHESQTVGHQKE